MYKYFTCSTMYFYFDFFKYRSLKTSNCYTFIKTIQIFCVSPISFFSSHCLNFNCRLHHSLQLLYISSNCICIYNGTTTTNEKQRFFVFFFFLAPSFFYVRDKSYNIQNIIIPTVANTPVPK